MTSPDPDTSFPAIQGLDTVKGMAMTGGTPEGYRQVLSMFRKDVEERVQKFRFFLYESMSSSDGKFPEKHLPLFITQIHALRSASATIGAEEVSAEAAKLETAGKGMDLAFIQDNLPEFVGHLTELIKNIHAALDTKTEESQQKSRGLGALIKKFAKQKPDKTALENTELPVYIPIFENLKKALDIQNVSDIDRALEELGKTSPDPKTKELLEQISDQILMTEFDSAKKTVDEFLDAASKEK